MKRDAFCTKTIKTTKVGAKRCKEENNNLKSENSHFLLSHSLPSTSLEIIIEEAVSPVTLSTVAGASIIVAIAVKIGKVLTGKPRRVIINNSDIVPPPIGIAVTKSVLIRAINIILDVLIFELNKYTKNIILKTLPMIEPSL